MDKWIVEPIREGALVPTRANDGDLCWDIYMCDERGEVVIPGCRLGFGKRIRNIVRKLRKRPLISLIHSDCIGTGIRIGWPSDKGGIVKDRSGLSIKGKLHVVAGVIDTGYRGELKIGMFNYGINDQTLRNGDRIAQIRVVKRLDDEPIVGSIDKDTERGSSGFGDSGR